MNIKQAEMITGISKRNIRFYEKEKLIFPNRNAENDYREYSEEDIKRLKMIRMLRMVDMPIDQIRKVLDGEVELGTAAGTQKEELYQQAKSLEAAIGFCKEIEKCSKNRDFNVDEMLKRMDAPENNQSLYMQWRNDYKKIAAVEHKKSFLFYPDTSVTNPGEFVLALCEYATAQNAKLEIVKEGMYPEFLLDGIEYKAERYYTTVGRVPVAAIRCIALHPEELETDLSSKRKKILKAVHYSWILLIFITILLTSGSIMPIGSWKEWFSTLEGWVITISMVVMAGVSTFLFCFYHYNEKQL